MSFPKKESILIFVRIKETVLLRQSLLLSNYFLIKKKTSLRDISIYFSYYDISQVIFYLTSISKECMLQ